MKKLPAPNIVDKAISYISPQLGFKRMQARAAMAVVGGNSYSSAGYSDRMVTWQPGIGDADANSLIDLRELRARSRDLVRNSPIAGGAIETLVSNVVGTGLRLIPRIDYEFLGLDEEQAEEWHRNVEREFMMWAGSELADSFGQLTFPEMQALAFRSMLESGDSFVVLTEINRPNWPYKLALQIIEADRISNPGWVADTDDMTAGIERDKNHAPIAVHISNRHPGRYIAPTDFKWTRIPVAGKSGRRNVLHLMQKMRPGQTRGIPMLAPIADSIKQLTRYSQAEVDAAVNSAVFALFAKIDPDSFSELFDDEAQRAYMNSAQRWDGTVKSGSVVNLLPGEEISSPTMTRPNPNYDGFMAAVMKQIGIGLGIPHEVLTKSFQSSYSAARAALLDAWRAFRIRRAWVAEKFCEPVYKEWLSDAIAAGRIDAPGFFDDPAIQAAWCGAQWAGDGPGAIDPNKEVEAAQKRVDMGLTTLAEEISQYDGGQWYEKHKESVRITKERVEAGLQVPAALDPGTPGAPVGPQQGGTQKPTETEKENDAMAHHTHVHLPESMRMEIPAPVVHVAAPVVNIPKADAPVVNIAPPSVHVAAPVVNVAAPEVTVEAVMPAASKASGFRVVSDADGNVTGVERIEGN